MNKRTKLARLHFVANPKPATLAETVRVPWTNDYVTVINICHLLTAMYGPNVWGSGYNYKQQCNEVNAWCTRHGIGYYAAPREDFGMLGAYNAAAEQGVTTVVIEDLS